MMLTKSIANDLLSHLLDLLVVSKRPTIVSGVPLSCLLSGLGQIVIGFLRCRGLIEGAVLEHGEQDVGSASSEGDDGLVVVFSFSAFLVVVGLRGGVGFDGGKC